MNRKKECCRCNQEKQVRSRSYCNSCFQAVEKKRKQTNRIWLDDYKLAAGCAHCGYDSHPRALSIDHLGKKNTRNRSGMNIDWSLGKIKRELENCQVLCMNCHMIKDCRGLRYELKPELPGACSTH